MPPEFSLSTESIDESRHVVAWSASRAWTASSRVGRIVKIWSSPVISNVLAMFGSVLTIVSTPSRERSRLTAPMSTPSAVESRNVVLVRSTTIRVWPDSRASPSADLSSGAVNRSISPLTATT